MEKVKTGQTVFCSVSFFFEGSHKISTNLPSRGLVVKFTHRILSYWVRILSGCKCRFSMCDEISRSFIATKFSLPPRPKMIRRLSSQFISSTKFSLVQLGPPRLDSACSLASIVLAAAGSIGRLIASYLPSSFRSCITVSTSSRSKVLIVLKFLRLRNLTAQFLNRALSSQQAI